MKPRVFQYLPHPQRRRAIIAAALFLLGVNDMSNHAISFESSRIGSVPEGWTATLTGSGDPAGQPTRCS